MHENMFHAGVMLQMAACWTNVKCVLVDDFAGIGTEQILILPESDGISECLNAFQITDLGKFNYAVRFTNVLQEFGGKISLKREILGK